MKTLVKQLWLEPAVFLHFLNGGLQVAQVLTVSDKAVNAILIAVGAGFFGATTRSLSKPASPVGR